MTTLPEAVARYARRFHAAVPDGQHVVSPLGAWLLLALLAPAAEGVARQRLEDALGMPADGAATAARGLLDAPHPAVASALALWTAPGVLRAGYERWAGTLPGGVTRDVLPDQAGLDAWAREHTLGLVERFPLEVRPDTVSVLASALAAKVRWWMHFDVVPAARLGPPWSTRVERVLHAPPGRHRVGVLPSAAGDVAVHVATSRDRDLDVVSVLAAPGQGRDAVLAAAHDITLVASGGDLPAAYDLFDLPLGDGHAWTVTEQTALVLGGREARADAVLPAWSASTRLDLLRDPALAVGDAAGVLAGLLDPSGGGPVEARQSAVARYTASGFEAAAVTAIGTRASAPLRTEGLLRTLEVRFGRPFAVVAVARGRDGGSGSAWDGVPVFSAWVEEPAEAEPAEPEGF